ncbi:MAG: SdrD B-like domain-containing protein [Pirellulaceae bacterium]
MANFFTKLMNRVAGSNSDSRRERRNGLRRKLRVEAMESRRLLASDLGAIEGNVFTDLTEDGLDVGDTAINGATVRLYNDVNTDGALDVGDTLITSQTTDASGDYLFADLAIGQYLVEQVAVTGQLQRAVETVKAINIADDSGTQTLVVDNFETVTTPDPLAAAAGATATDQQTGLATEIIGLERDVEVINDGGSGSNLQFDIDPGGLVIIDAGVATTGDVFVTYDGADGSASTIGHNLGGIDLTANDGRGFEFRVGSQVGSFLTVEVYSGDNLTASSRQLVIPTTAGGAATEDLFFAFADFTQLGGAGASADFTNVSAIRFHADVAAADDVSIDFVGIQGLNPQTANFANLNPMSIGDLVFSDIDDSGALNGAETGIQNVEVQLYEDTNTNGTYDDGVDTQVAGGTTTTDANGNYLFTDLFPGEYIALVPISQFSGGNALEGFATSTGNDPAPDPDDNTNSDDNATLIVGVGVATQALTLTAGSEPTDDGDTDENTNLALDFGFVPQIDLAVSKQAGATQVIAGNQLTYTINVSNVGQATATNVVLVDDLPNLLPDNVTIVSAVSTNGTVTQPGNANGEIEVAYASLAAGGTDTVTVVLEFPDTAAAATGITNTVSISADEVETNTANNTDAVDVDIIRQAVLQLTKTDSVDPVTVGNALTYQIVVTNTGPSTATNVQVTDTLPAGLTLGTVTTTLGTATPTGNSFTVDIASLAVNQSATVTVNTTVDSTFAGTSLDNTATANADEATQVTADANTTVNPAIELAITKTDSVDPATRGNTLIYTLDITNSGPSAANNVVVTDTLPANVTFVSATGGTVTAPSGSSNDVLVDIGTLASGANQQVTVTVTIDADAPDTITNTASVTSTETAGGFEANTTNNSVTEPTALNPSIDLVVTKADSIDPVIAGNSLVYTVIVTNNGPSQATNVSLTDTLPAGVTFTSATSTQGTATNAGGVVTADIGALASGASATVTINVGVDSTTTGTINNTASVTATETETDTSNNSVTEPTTVNTSVDLALTKTESTDTVATGSALAYTILVTNNGPSTATGVTVTDTLPSELSFDSASTTQGTTTNNGSVVTADVGTLGPGETATVTINTTVIATTDGIITNTASVAAAEAETVTTNNSDSENTTLTAQILSKRFLLASA